MNFMNLQNRNAEYKKQIKAGKLVRKTSIRNQLLHPMYVSDYETETGKVLTDADKGFGNTIYKTYFAALYQIEPILSN